MRRERLSRNRHFDELSHPTARRAHKILRRLDALARELRTVAAVTARRHQGGVVVTMAWPDIRLERVAYLTSEEHTLLLDDPALAMKLALE
jgi:hypothetical protein